MEPTINWRRRILFLLIAMSSVAIGMISGGTLYAAFVLEPLWTYSPDAIRGWWSQEPVIDGRGFLAGIGAPISVFSLFVLGLGWYETQPVRTWILAYFVGITMVGMASVLYLQPLELKVIEYVAAGPDDELQRMVDTWVLGNLVRCCLGLACLGILLRTLTLAYHPFHPKTT